MSNHNEEKLKQAIKDAGGPAFPTSVENNANTCPQGVGDTGMTLRDYFAAKAMQGYLDHYGAKITGDVNKVARFGYEIADAMIAERSKK